MQISPSASLIAALSSAGGGARPMPANAAGAVGSAPGIAVTPARPIAPAQTAPQSPTAPTQPGRHSPLGRLIDIRV